MPFKKAVETYNRRDEQRRNLAELRVAYGNAISDSNLGRMRMQTVTCGPRRCISSLPFGQFANSYSWQLSNSCSGKLTQKVTAACTSQLNDKHGTNAKDPCKSTIFGRYDALQRQARLRTTFMKHLDRVKSPNGEETNKKLDFDIS